MFHSIDFVVILVSFFVQARVHILLREAAAGRGMGGWTGPALFLFDLLVAGGYLCSYSGISSDLPIPPRIAMLAGACTLAYLMLATAGIGIQLVFAGIGKLARVGADPQRRRVLRTAGRIALAAPAVTLGYGFFIERHRVGVREVDVPSPGLPRDLDGIRILQVSDIHLGAFFSEGELARVIDEANGLRANVAVITGDLISSRGDPLDACIAQLARLRADAGVFGCLGNHERYAQAEDYATDRAAHAGIRILRDQAAALEFGGALLNIAGVDYQRWSPQHEYLRGAGRLRAADAWNVLLSHNPDVLPSAAREGYNLVLSGHTHGGQVTVEILDQSLNPARFFTPYVRGLYRVGAASGYVTRGIGTIGIPARVGAPPEISLLRLRKA